MKTTGGKEYFWNYNTIEATLLACAVFVCLAGIMFESSQFDDRPDLIWMQDMIAVVVAIAQGMLFGLEKKFKPYGVYIRNVKITEVV